MTRPILEKPTYKIQGVTGHLEQPKGEVKNLPLRFKKKGPVWGLNACIMNSASADIILGTNFLNRYKAMLNLPKKRLTLTNLNGMQEEVQLIEKHQLHIQSVNIIEAMDTDQLQELDAMEIDPNPKWKCKKGPKELACMRVFIPDDVDDDREPCSKCAPRVEEQAEFQRKKAYYETLKYDAHSDGWRNHVQYAMERSEVDDAYDMYIKGTQLAANGDIVDKDTVYGNVGFDWTVHHPEWKPTKKRRRDPLYEVRTKKWRRMFVDFPEEDQIARGAMEHYEKKQLEKEVYQLEVPYVLQKKK